MRGSRSQRKQRIVKGINVGQTLGQEDHEQLDIIPAQINVLRHRRLKYACPCCQGYLVTAAKPILDQIDSWLQKSLPNVPPKTALGKALQYLHNQWPRLIRYVEDGHYPIDNNPAENAIRPFAIGLNPYAYLKQVFEVLPNAETVEAIETLLPWKVNLK